DEGAVRLLSALMSITIKSWAEGILLEEGISLGGLMHPLEAISHLGDELIQNSGIARLVRVALRPLAQTAVATPLQWKLNKQYRPKMLSAGEVIKGFHAGRIDEATMREVLTRDGLSDEAIAELVTADEHHLS